MLFAVIGHYPVKMLAFENRNQVESLPLRYWTNKINLLKPRINVIP
jgi:hypothetical protein